MIIDNTIVMLDTCTKFLRGLTISGWLHASGETLSEIDFLGETVVFKAGRTGLRHGGVASLGSDKGFDLQIVLADTIFPNAAALVFKLGERILHVPLDDLLTETLGRQTVKLSQDFFDQANKPCVNTILDIGGRARSLVDRSRRFPGKEVTVLDVLDGDNVTVVGDAHEMSSFLPREHFDAFLSISVFEHLLMPWKVAIEINHVLKPGGFGLVHTHQTLGMHDMPWDFWRFSDSAWDAIFNAFTGFEIVERALAYPSYILPFVYRSDKVDAEKALGFEGSSVIVRKVGLPKVSWDVRTSEVIPTIYPSN